ncbi:MAG: SUMF1/EgtB/PvdO family nonheme iron enzyme, partial [Verrucomicrobia bacterium]|nr:SUMF1/EgtB/PvdO family nonheme iron enzyme [Verrucomicrobiota bacterium]
MHRSNRTRWLQLQSICLISLAALGSLYAEPQAEIPVLATFADGHTVRYSVSNDDKVTLETCAGKLRFPARAISSISCASETEIFTANLTSGECWSAVAEGDILDLIGLEANVMDIARHGHVRKVEFETHDRPTPYRADGMRLLLEDGGHSLIDVSKTLLSVETEGGWRELPVGGLRALKFMSDGEDENDGIVLVRFPSGSTERLCLRSRSPYFKAKDYYDNTLKVPHSDISGILGSKESTGDSVSSADSNPDLNSPTVLLEDGQSVAVHIPFSIWNLKTKAGDFLLPSYQVSSLERTGNRNSEVRIRTIYSEVMVGDLPNRELQISSGTNEDNLGIRLDTFLSVNTGAQPRDIPNHWLVWYLNTGSAVVGRFSAASSGLKPRDGEDIDSRDITSVSAIGKREFLVAMDSGGPIRCTPSSRHAKLTLLINDMSVAIPWSQICGISSSQAISDEIWTDMLAGQTTEPAEEKSSGSIEAQSDDTARPLRVSTPLGTLELDPSLVSSVRIAERRSKACIETCSGDQIITSLPSRRWIEQWQQLEEYDWPDTKLSYVIAAEAEQTYAVQSKTAVCRLLTGDIFYGNVPAQTLEITSPKGGRTVEMASSDLVHLSRDIDGHLSFISSQGNATPGIPSSRTLDFVLSVSGVTNSIPFKQVETLLIGSIDLPPSTVFRPHLPPALTGEILIEAGSFDQGSLSGLDDEQPVHRTSVGAYYMDATEVTRAQFAGFARDTGYETVAEENNALATWRTPGFVQRMDDPVVCISWFDAAAYCNWRSEQAGLEPCYDIEGDDSVIAVRAATGYRLPTEAEWEFAACGRGIHDRHPWNALAAKRDYNMANFRSSDSASGDGWEW